MSYAGEKGRLRAKNKAAKSRLERLKSKGKGDSEKAEAIRGRIQDRREKLKKIDTRGPRPQGSPYGLTTAGTGSTLVDKSVQGFTELGKKYKDNEMLGGMIIGSYGDFLRTQANTGLAIQYNDAMYESMGRYQGNLENLRTGNTAKLMAQEGAITGGLMDKQGKLQQEGLRVAGDEQRKGIRETGSEERLTLGERGRQERSLIREKTGAQLRMRSDARGAIARSGARFFG